jgi:hypothetical protein
MKIKIASTILIKQDWLDEVKELIPDAVFEVVTTHEMMTVYYNPSQQSNYGDFDSVKRIVNATIPVDARVYIMSYDQLRTLGITNHLALYNNADRDGVLDTYIGLNTVLDPRAITNGFRSNFAWEICHELSHGREQNLGREYMATIGDRTHAWEAQSRLKELWLTDTVSFLQNILRDLLAKIYPPMQHPVPLPYRNQITQQYGVENPIYTITGHHIGCDYACPIGTPLRAPANGRIVGDRTSKERGRFVQFQHGNYLLEMRHLSQVMLLGDYKAGDVIAYSGNSGNLTTGPHTCMVTWVGKDGLGSINKINWSSLTTDPNKLYK